ncbi:putative transcriptional regulator, GntR family [Phaeobacter piscinae]|uniref:Transcriptional regulator, GntR family n=1 Tax=Phaeobacter piscinae TaxID=1580596 RepID=A0ABM6P9G4_9RHOB|nr:PLP-dependent aminotransferase family protein [Phaeobacter piscinae]ATG34313.1 putative transcriptional regulator, GntR family [Phaeobacter piscinae]AUQ84833.1 putative transcriptional regulator, GntR family [Phaeobacter piscinae]AUR22716.1 putative transcriptional regulator, GntR family [Phaeobacter piscinae]
MPKARYIQLADTIARAIQSGKLTPGSRLPTHRAFADQFEIALATATRVYGELERRGLVVGEAGRGTFVRDDGLPMALGVHQTATDGLIDLVFNMPGDAGDADVLRAGLRKLATAGDLEAMLRYQPHGGRSHERRIIANNLNQSLGSVDPERLLVTSGGQHGLAITALGLLRHGDAVATDTLTYPGFKSVAALQGLDLVSVDGVEGAMVPDDLDRKCRSGQIRAVYLMPTVHNPLGAVMGEATRLALIHIARKHDLIIIEDAAYAFLENDPPPTFLALAPERTVYIGGFSKSIATGLRLGYVIAPAGKICRLVEAIRATTWNAPALISGLVTGWIEDGTLGASEETRRQDGAERQQLCRAALTDLPIIAHPNAGFAWLPLAKNMRAEPIVSRLRNAGISVSGAEPFATTVAVPQALRLAFGGVKKNDLTAILALVSKTVKNHSFE